MYRDPILYATFSANKPQILIYTFSELRNKKKDRSHANRTCAPRVPNKPVYLYIDTSFSSYTQTDVQQSDPLSVLFFILFETHNSKNK